MGSTIQIVFISFVFLCKSTANLTVLPKKTHFLSPALPGLSPAQGRDRPVGPGPAHRIGPGPTLPGGPGPATMAYRHLRGKSGGPGPAHRIGPGPGRHPMVSGTYGGLSLAITDDTWTLTPSAL